MKSNEVASKAPVILDANSTEMPSNETVSSEVVVVEANPTDTIPNETVPVGILSIEMIDDYVDRFSSANHPDLMIKKFPTGFEVIDRVA